MTLSPSRRLVYVSGCCWVIDSRKSGADTVASQFGQNKYEIEVVVPHWSDPTAGLESGYSDLAILAGPTELDEKLRSIVLGYEPRVAVFADSLALARKGHRGPWMTWTPSVGSRLRHGARTIDGIDSGWPKIFEVLKLRELPGAVSRLLKSTLSRFKGRWRGDLSPLGDRGFIPDGKAIRPVDDLPPVPIRFAYRSDIRVAGLEDLGVLLRGTLFPASQS